MSLTDKNELDIYEGTILGTGHQVESFVGEGFFGFVTKCVKTDTNETVAIKVIKNSPKIVRQARIELALLKELQCLDPDTCNIVRHHGYFFHKENICISFELLDQSLFAYAEERSFSPLPIPDVSPVLYQVATALYYLKILGIVHADVKYENIMIVDRHQKPLKVKLIDFGLSYKSSGYPHDFVQTIYYRAPEVMLGLPFNEAIDVWSLGVIATEFVLGNHLYPGNNQYEMLNYIQRTQGPLPDHMLDHGVYTEDYFIFLPDSEQKWQLLPEDDFLFQDEREHMLDSLDNLMELMVWLKGPQPGQCMYVDLVKSMLQLDPDVRIQPHAILEHPVFLQTSNEMDKSENEIQMTPAANVIIERPDAADKPPEKEKTNQGRWNLIEVVCNIIPRIFQIHRLFKYLIFSPFKTKLK